MNRLAHYSSGQLQQVEELETTAASLEKQLRVELQGFIAVGIGRDKEGPVLLVYVKRGYSCPKGDDPAAISGRSSPPSAYRDPETGPAGATCPAGRQGKEEHE